MTGEYRIAAAREAVWAALNDAEVLKQCIPGCDSLDWLSDHEIEAVVTARVGPVKARFKGRVTLSDLDPPSSYTISGEGQGGAAGFARGSARVTLADDGDGTLLRYTVKASVGGKLAQIGARLIDSAAKKMANDFFAAFAAIAGGEGDVAAGEAAGEVAEAPAAAGGLSPWLWVPALIALVALGLYYYGVVN